jgi:excisionase family DNA binding protein
MSQLRTKAESLLYLRIGKTKFHQQLNRKEIRAVKIGRRLYVEQDELDRYIASLPVYEPSQVETGCPKYGKPTAGEAGEA